MLKNAIWLFVLTIIVLAVFLPAYSKMQDLRQKNQEYKEKVVQLEARIVEMKQERTLLKDDPEYLEKVAREKMGLIREGESVIKIEQPK